MTELKEKSYKSQRTHHITIEMEEAMKQVAKAMENQLEYFKKQDTLNESEVEKRRKIRKSNPPIFKRFKGERPETHLLRAKDWMDLHLVKPAERVTELKHTLDGGAREWYDTTNTSIPWEDFKKKFNQRNTPPKVEPMPELHERWIKFKFRKRCR